MSDDDRWFLVLVSDNLIILIIINAKWCMIHFKAEIKLCGISRAE